MSNDKSTHSYAETQTAQRVVRRIKTGRYPFSPYGLIPLICLLMVLTFGLIPFARGWVQRTTEQTARQALSDIGASWATPNVSGQWVALEGTPPSRSDAAKALEAVRTAKAPVLFGSARPATRVRITHEWPTAESAAPAATPANDITLSMPDWTFHLSDGVLRLSGDIPDEATRQALLDAARAVLDPPRLASIDDALLVTGDAVHESYVDVALRGVNTVARCDSGQASFTGGSFSLVCELPEAMAADVRAMANAPMPIGQLGSVDILTSEAIASCETRLSDLLGATRIEFATSSAVIDDNSSTVLDAIALAAAACPGTLRIEGHTDNVGRAEYNEGLSRRRADAVRTALIVRGLPRTQLLAEGFGIRQPIADNDTEAGRARNRRIEIRVVRASD